MEEQSVRRCSCLIFDRWAQWAEKIMCHGNSWSFHIEIQFAMKEGEFELCLRWPGTSTAAATAMMIL
jgi:hypothetical protein